MDVQLELTELGSMSASGGLTPPAPRPKPDKPLVITPELMDRVRKAADPVALLGLEGFDVNNIQLLLEPGVKNNSGLRGSGDFNVQAGEFIRPTADEEKLAAIAGDFRGMGFDDFIATPDSIILVNTADEGVILHELRHRGLNILRQDDPLFIATEDLNRAFDAKNPINANIEDDPTRSAILRFMLRDLVKTQPAEAREALLVKAKDASKRAQARLAGEEVPFSFTRSLIELLGLEEQFKLPEAKAEASIDPNKPQLVNPDFSISTEETITITVKENGKEVFVNIPTIVDGKRKSDDQAIKLFEQGKNAAVGNFTTLEQAITAAKSRSEEIGKTLE